MWKGVQLKLCPFTTAADLPEATLRFANYYGDHMVLQRAPHSANVWGFMPACDDKVEVTFGEKMYNAMLSQGELVYIIKILLPQNSNLRTKVITVFATSNAAHKLGKSLDI